MSKSAPTATVEAVHNGSSTDNRSQNVLVALTGTAIDHRLVREAETYAAGTGNQLVLLSVMSPREFSDQQKAFARIEDLPRYTLSQAIEKHNRIAARIGREALGSSGTEYTAVGSVGQVVDRVLIAADAYDCGHVFLVDQPQSVLRRLVDGNPVQRVTRRFDGFVTVIQDEGGGKTTGEQTRSPSDNHYGLPR